MAPKDHANDKKEPGGYRPPGLGTRQRACGQSKPPSPGAGLLASWPPWRCHRLVPRWLRPRCAGCGDAPASSEPDDPTLCSECNAVSREDLRAWCAEDDAIIYPAAARTQRIT